MSATTTSAGPISHCSISHPRPCLSTPVTARSSAGRCLAASSTTTVGSRLETVSSLLSCLPRLSRAWRRLPYSVVTHRIEARALEDDVPPTTPVCSFRSGLAEHIPGSVSVHYAGWPASVPSPGPYSRSCHHPSGAGHHLRRPTSVPSQLNTHRVSPRDLTGATITIASPLDQSPDRRSVWRRGGAPGMAFCAPSSPILSTRQPSKTPLTRHTRMQVRLWPRRIGPLISFGTLRSPLTPRGARPVSVGSRPQLA